MTFIQTSFVIKNVKKIKLKQLVKTQNVTRINKRSKKFDEKPHCMGRPSNCPVPGWESGPPPNTWFLGLTRDRIPNDTLIGSAAFAGLTVVTDRQTDRQTDHATCVATGLIFALCACDAA